MITEAIRFLVPKGYVSCLLKEINTITYNFTGIGCSSSKAGKVFVNHNCFNVVHKFPLRDNTRVIFTSVKRCVFQLLAGIFGYLRFQPVNK